MLRESKSDQLFVKKTKLANYVQQVISKMTKEKKLFQILTIHCCWENFKIVCWKSKTCREFVCRYLDLKWFEIYLEILLPRYS